MAVSANNRRHLKRSLSLDVGLDTDQPVDESFKPAMSRKSRRKAGKKTKALNHSNGSVHDNLTNRSSPSHDDDPHGHVNPPSVSAHPLTQASLYSSQESIPSDNTAVGSSCSHCSLCSQCRSNESVIKSVKSEVNNLNETVNQLTTQIQMLSAALGLTSSTISAASQPQQTSAVPANAETSRKSYAAAAKPGMVQQMHCNSVSAVYVDLEQRKKRANNVVINGLTNDKNFDDSLKL